VNSARGKFSVNIPAYFRPCINLTRFMSGWKGGVSNTGWDHTGLRTCHAPLYVNTSDPSTLSLLTSKQPYRTEHYYYILIYLFFSIVQLRSCTYSRCTEISLYTRTEHEIMLLCNRVCFSSSFSSSFFLYISSSIKTSLLYPFSTLLCPCLLSNSLRSFYSVSFCLNYSFFHLPHS